jgi:hypothetical protein
MTLILLLAALVIDRDHPLVQIASDPPDSSTALFPTGELLPGQSTSAAVTLTNRGLLPFTYSLSATGPTGQAVPGDFRLSVRHAANHVTLYEGPLPFRSPALGTLNPGEQARLDLRLALPAAAVGARSNLNLLFHWHASGDLSSRWWLPRVELLLAALDLVILFLFARRLIRGARAPQRREPTTI